MDHAIKVNYYFKWKIIIIKITHVILVNQTARVVRILTVNVLYVKLAMFLIIIFVIVVQIIVYPVVILLRWWFALNAYKVLLQELVYAGNVVLIVLIVNLTHKTIYLGVWHAKTWVTFCFLMESTVL